MYSHRLNKIDSAELRESPVDEPHDPDVPYYDLMAACKLGLFLAGVALDNVHRGTMAKDHFIPAALLARFSEEQHGAMRDRKLHVMRRNAAPRTAPARAFGFENGLYDVDENVFTSSEGRAIDNLWEVYEPNLTSVLDDLIDGKQTGSDWIRVLVPFVAATFARDRSYADRVEERLKRDFDDPKAEASWILEKTNLNMNRLLEMNRFAAKAIVCEWHLYEADGDLIVPDMGFGFNLRDPFEGKDVVGVLLPLGRRHLLELVPVPERLVARRFSDGDWRVPIIHAPSAATSTELNKCLAQCAQDFVAGTEAAVASVASEDMAKFDPAGIDAILGQWPFNVDTLDLSGIHAPLDRLLHNEAVDLDHWLLNRFESVVGLEPGMDFLFAQLAARAPASCFLASTETTISVRAHATNK